MMIPIILIAASIATSLPTSGEALQATVTYADLDLSTKAGQKTLDRRITGAVRKICGNQRSATLTERRAIQRCHSSAMNDANDKAEIVVARARMNRQLANATLAVAEVR